MTFNLLLTDSDVLQRTSNTLSTFDGTSLHILNSPASLRAREVTLLCSISTFCPGRRGRFDPDFGRVWWQVNTKFRLTEGDQYPTAQYYYSPVTKPFLQGWKKSWTLKTGLLSVFPLGYYNGRRSKVKTITKLVCPAAGWLSNILSAGIWLVRQ